MKRFKNTDVFIDVDGTIYAPELEQISPEFVSVVERLRQLGHRIFIASGRTSSFLPSLLYPHLCDGYVLAHGEQIILDDKRIYSRYLPETIVRELIAALDEDEVDYVCYGENHSYLNRAGSEMHGYLSGLCVEPETFRVIDDDFDFGAVYKIEAWGKEQDYWDDLLSAFDELKYDPDPVSPRVDINLRESTKALGIKRLLDYLDSDSRETVCFGDARNDLEMFELVDYPIAVGNADERLKKRAWKVAPSVYQDGVKVFLSEYFD